MAEEMDSLQKMRRASTASRCIHEHHCGLNAPLLPLPALALLPNSLPSQSQHLLQGAQELPQGMGCSGCGAGAGVGQRRVVRTGSWHGPCHGGNGHPHGAHHMYSTHSLGEDPCDDDDDDEDEEGLEEVEDLEGLETVEEPEEEEEEQELCFPPPMEVEPPSGLEYTGMQQVEVDVGGGCQVYGCTGNHVNATLPQNHLSVDF